MNMYYSIKEKILFQFAGYAACNNTENVVQKCNLMLEIAKEFAEKNKIPLNQVCFYTVAHSDWCLNHAILYAVVDTIETASEGIEIISQSLLDFTYKKNNY